MSERNLKDAFYGANFRVGQGLLTRDKSTGSNDLTDSTFENIQTWDVLTDQVATGEAFDEVTDSERAMDDCTESGVAFDVVTDKEVAMDLVTDKEIAMDKVTDKEVAMDKVMSKVMARDKFYGASHSVDKGILTRSQEVNETVLTESNWTQNLTFDQITDNNTNMDEMTDSERSMDDATSSEVAMELVADKEMPMDLVTDKEMPMDLVTDKEIAMDKVTDKEIAMDLLTDKEAAMEVLSDKQSSFDFVLDNISKSAIQQFLVDEITAKSMAVGKFVQGGAFIDSTGVSSENVTDIDTLTDSNDRIEEITDSERAMDAATESELAMNKVTDKEMPMDKVTDKEVAMDAVSDSEVAMDKVSDSEVAMDAVTDKPFATGVFLKSPHLKDTHWSKITSSEIFWNKGEARTNIGDGGSKNLINNDLGGKALELTYDYSSDETYSEYDTLIIDFDQLNSLIVQLSVESGASRPDLIISVDNTTLYENLENADDDNPEWTERNFNVSSISGEQLILIETGVSNSSSTSGTVESRIRFIEG